MPVPTALQSRGNVPWCAELDLRIANVSPALCDGSARRPQPGPVPQRCTDAVAELMKWPRGSAPPVDGNRSRAALHYAVDMLLRVAGAQPQTHGSQLVEPQDVPGITRHRHARQDPEVPQDASTRRWRGSQLVALGGRDASWRGTARAAAYDVVADVWHRLPDLPHVLPCARAIGVQASLYAWGSYVPPVCLDVGDKWESARWHEAAAHEALKRLIGFEALAAGHDAWLLGGRSLPNDVRSQLVLRPC